MARPRKGEEKRATDQIGVRVSAELRAEIEAAAAASGRTLTDEVRELIVDGLTVRKKGRPHDTQRAAKSPATKLSKRSAKHAPLGN